MTAPRTFVHWALTVTPLGEFSYGIVYIDEDIQADVLERLRTNAHKIESLAQLQRFARERWPYYWSVRTTPDQKSLADNIKNIWADYLAWAEAVR